MSVNRYKEHVFVLPEDDANRQLANGFLLEMPDRSRSQMRILPVAGGWKSVLDEFLSKHINYVERYPLCAMVLAIDFDGQDDRFFKARSQISQKFADRVFIFGVWTRPEDLKQAGLGSYEQIGRAMCRDCRYESQGIWKHDLLKHNSDELRRLRKAPIGKLFE